MPVETRVPRNRIESLQIMANRLRRHSLVSTTEAGSGHPTSCLSCAELMSVLFFHYLRFDVKNPHLPANDRFVLSKGHAAPILWAAWAEAGAFPVEHLGTLRRFDSDLEGHPTPRNPLVDAATGSLGQGLSIAAGMAHAFRLDRIPGRVFTLLGDGESAEGSVWEAAALASRYRLDNLVAIIDVNRLGQSQETMYGHDLEGYVNRFTAFGWHARAVDGHDVEAIIAALDEALATSGRPSVLVARTIKGKGVSFLEDRLGYHGRPVSRDELGKALEEIGDPPLPEPLGLALPASRSGTRPAPVSQAAGEGMPDPEYGPNDRLATRMAFGNALRKLGHIEPRIVALDAEVMNSTHSEEFLKDFPERFIECYIAEQNMLGVATGLGVMGKIPFASTFACFLTRAYDFIRMAAISNANLKLCGSHAGVSIGEDGPSQMGLEDIAMMRAVAGSTVLYPSDAVATERLVAVAARTPGIVYLRTTRASTPILYSNSERFVAGGSKTVRSSADDRATVVAAGITLHEALKAHAELAREGVAVRVIDLYSVKPLDRDTLLRAARETGAVVTVEDHYPEGGLGEAVARALLGTPCRVRQLAVNALPRSGKPGELLDAYGISARRIIEAVKETIAG
jgi:transketolase